MANPGANDPRRLLAAAWERLSSEQHEELLVLAMESWRVCLGASKPHTVKGHVYECRKCHAMQMVDVTVELPDILTRAKAFEVLASQSHGKVPERRQVEVDVGDRTLAALERLSTAELARLAGGDEEWLAAIEAEWAELPAPEAA